MFILVVVLILGLYTGSFITAVAFRIASEEKTFVARSKCDNCGIVLSFLYLIPIVGYILCKGKCIKCQKCISIKYTIWEVLHACAYLLNFYVFQNNLVAFFLFCGVTSILFLISIIDIQVMYIYDIHIIILLIFFVCFLYSVGELKITLFSFMKAGIPLCFKVVYENIRAKITKEKVVVIGIGDIKLFTILFFLLDFSKSIMIILESGLIGMLFGLLKRPVGDNHYPFIPSISLSLYTLFIWVFL